MVTSHARGRLPSGAPNPIDVHVGSRVRERRMALGIGQVKLGEALGITFQQVQKYERGANRIGASRLFDLSQILKVSPSHFFEGMTAKVAAASPRNLDGSQFDTPVDEPKIDVYAFNLAMRIRLLDERERAVVTTMVNALMRVPEAAE